MARGSALTYFDPTSGGVPEGTLGNWIGAGRNSAYKSNQATLSGATGFQNSSLDISASRYNPIYGNSNTVQPPAIQLIPQIKY